jgi:hypothetical protein
LGQPRKEEGFNKEWQTNKRRWELGSLTIEKRLKDCVGRSMEEWRSWGLGQGKGMQLKWTMAVFMGMRGGEEEDG